MASTDHSPRAGQNADRWALTPDARGELFRAFEAVEFCSGLSSLLQGESLHRVAQGMDIASHRVPLGVCAGLSPFNFPAMIPLFMFPVSIACGNTFVLKVPASNLSPLSALPERQ